MKKKNKLQIIPDYETSFKYLNKALTNTPGPIDSGSGQGCSGESLGMSEDFEYWLGEDLKPLLKGTEFIYMNRFNKKCKDLEVTEEDLRDLENQLTERAPDADLGAGVFKFRWSPLSWNRGRSRSTRVIYISILLNNKAYLVDIFTKNDKANLTERELKVVKDLARELKRESR